MYNDLFSIGPISVHSYGVCIAAGLLACLALACFRAKKSGLNGDVCYGILFSGVIAGIIGAKVTYLFVEWDEFIEDPSRFFSESGFVVMGGLLCGILAAWVYLRFVRKVSFLDYFDLCAPSIAIAQGFGRIGCFMAGCCYGKETDSVIGIVFTNSHYARNNVKLIPTQLISSALDFLNMAFLILLAKKTKKKGVVFAAYVITYSAGRFILEFFRGDIERGFIGGLSTSQFLSIISMAIGIIFLFVVLKLKNKKTEELQKSGESEKAEESEKTEESDKPVEVEKVAEKKSEEVKDSSETVETDAKEAKEPVETKEVTDAEESDESDDTDNYEEPEEPEDL